MTTEQKLNLLNDCKTILSARTSSDYDKILASNTLITLDRLQSMQGQIAIIKRDLKLNPQRLN
ncbi:hypothetical protein MNBD_GAMMA12-2635 [hydrothermal vent metagenome]|uniref:Uncharacterized protein n=2 Tax=hydrothermal vent metagenome TaxID=652676 RepID=A0A3B0ZRA7_9ZZZZ